MSSIRALSSVMPRATSIPTIKVNKASPCISSQSRAFSNRAVQFASPKASHHQSSQNPTLRLASLPSRNLSHSTASLSTPPKSKPNPEQPAEESIPTFNIWAQVRASKPAVRYTIYTGFALAATAETTFWANVIYAKWFAGEEDKERADAFLERFQEAVKGYRARWMINYGSYWSAHLWGL